MMKNRAPPARDPATRIDTLELELSVDAGHGNGAFGKIYD
jgi:hypothetical protein